MSKVVSVQLFFLILGNSFAWDGCSYGLAWRCGDVCIDMNAECKCGDEIFAKEDQKWCCHNSCVGKGGKDSLGTWNGEEEGDKKIGAECLGRELNLTEACDQKCNYFEDDVTRNVNGVQRGLMPCNADATHVKITESVQVDKMRDGKYYCRNRADEEAFANSSSLLLDWIGLTGGYWCWTSRKY